MLPGYWKSESGSVSLQNVYFSRQKQRMEAILSISRRKPLLQTRAWSATEKQPPHGNLIPFPNWKALKPLCWNPNCQGLLSCCSRSRTEEPFHLQSTDVQCVRPSLKRSVQTLATLLIMFFELKEGKVALATNCLARDCPGLGYLGSELESTWMAFQPLFCQLSLWLPVVGLTKAQQGGFGFSKDGIPLQLPRRQCCKIQAFRSLSQKPWSFWAVFINSVILNF